MAEKTTLIKGFAPVKGSKGQRIFDTINNKEISRRQYEKVKYGGISKEEVAKLNRLTNIDLALSRPTRGRSDIRNLTPEVKNSALEVRKLNEKQKEKKRLELKREKDLARRIKRAESKKVKTIRINEKTLKPGSYGKRVFFDNYESYKKAQKQMETMGDKIFVYSMGLILIDERDGEMLSLTMFKMLPPTEIISEDDLNNQTEAWLEEKAYARFISWFIQIGFSVKFADKWARDHGLKVRDRQDKPPSNVISLNK